eukprot:scaffold754_cov289-Pavlova_lutheri.AAC.7
MGRRNSRVHCDISRYKSVQDESKGGILCSMSSPECALALLHLPCIHFLQQRHDPCKSGPLLWGWRPTRPHQLDHFSVFLHPFLRDRRTLAVLDQALQHPRIHAPVRHLLRHHGVHYHSVRVHVAAGFAVSGRIHEQFRSRIADRQAR